MSRSWSQFSDWLSSQAREQSIPISGQFELTARCNLQCQMCYVCQPANERMMRSQELTAAQWIHLAAQARDSGMLYLLLTGGEVFLRSDFKEIYEEMSKMGFRITVYSNGTLITSEIAKWLGRIPPANIEISLYGASAATYAKVTGHADAYERTLRGIDSLLAEGVAVQLRTTVIPANTSDHDKLVELAGIRNRVLRYGFYISPRRGEHTGVANSLRLSPFELTQYELHAGKAYSQGVTEIRKKYGITGEPDVIDDSNNGNQTDNDDYPFKCSAGKSVFWVTWDGKMTPCGTMEEPATQPFQTGFAAAWQELSELCALIPSCLECQQCSFKNACWTCPARLKSETGSFVQPSPYLCAWAQSREKYF